MEVVFVEILPRLPVKSLIRFKCVSKSFKTTISSKNFAQFYLRYRCVSPEADDLLILPGDCRIICYDLDSTPTATFTWDDRSSVSVVGSSNGLLCIFTRNAVDYLTVVNPLTRICQDIPFPVNGGRGHSIGFAFDYENLDFKIVDVWDHHDRSAVKTRVTRVYSLNANSWKIIETTLPTDAIEERHGGVLINYNLLHWMFWSPSLRKRRIGCFDVCKSKWADDVLLPHYYYDPTHMNYFLDFGVLDNCLFSSFKNLDESSYDVWVMSEYGVQNSWVKLLSIPASNDLLGGVVPVACRRGSEEILIRKRHCARLLWYNKIDGGMTEAEFDEAPDFSNLQAYMGSRSLVDIPGSKLFGDPRVKT